MQNQFPGGEAEILAPTTEGAKARAERYLTTKSEVREAKLDVAKLEYALSSLETSLAGLSKPHLEMPSRTDEEIKQEEIDESNPPTPTPAAPDDDEEVPEAGDDKRRKKEIPDSLYAYYVRLEVAVMQRTKQRLIAHGTPHLPSKRRWTRLLRSYPS